MMASMLIFALMRTLSNDKKSLLFSSAGSLGVVAPASFAGLPRRGTGTDVLQCFARKLHVSQSADRTVARPRKGGNSGRISAGRRSVPRNSSAGIDSQSERARVRGDCHLGIHQAAAAVESRLIFLNNNEKRNRFILASSKLTASLRETMYLATFPRFTVL